MRPLRWLLAMLWTLALSAQGPDDMPGRAALKDATPCLPCHRDDATARWTSHRHQACTPYCQTCHSQADMALHHTVGTVLVKPLKGAAPLTSNRRTACFTCHDLAQPRYDQVRWKAESLFGRLVRRQARYKTYLLVTRNDRGQLCLGCH